MKKNKGFTLVEIIVILVILAILAAVLIPSLTTYIDKAREKSITANARGAYVAAQAIASEQYGVNEMYDWYITTQDEEDASGAAALGVFGWVDPDDLPDSLSSWDPATTATTKTVVSDVIMGLAQLKEEQSNGSYTEIDNVTQPKLLFVGVDDGEVGWFVYTEGKTGSNQQRWAVHEANGAWTIYKPTETTALTNKLKDLIDKYNSAVTGSVDYVTPAT